MFGFFSINNNSQKFSTYIIKPMDSNKKIPYSINKPIEALRDIIFKPFSDEEKEFF